MAVTVEDIESNSSPVNDDVSSSYKEICTRTSWTDARTALSHITKGRASGRRDSLWLRSRLQDHLQSVGQFCDRHADKVLFVAILVLGSFCVGLKSATLITDVEELWVQEGGRLQDELQYVERTLGKGAGSTKQILLQTSSTAGVNILNAPALLTHLEILKTAIEVTVDLNDTTWSFQNICYAPTFPEFEKYYIEQIFESLTPCTIITPLDCFWEGSLLLGPEHPVKIPGIGSGVRWSNLNPSKLVEKIERLSQQSYDLFKDASGVNSYTSFVDFFKRAGITTAYQEKPCLNPLDGDCPSTAPNKGSKEPLDIGAELSGGCYGFAGRYMHWPEHLIVGSTTKNKTAHIVRAEALQSMVQLMGSKNLYEFYHNDWKVHNMDWTQEKAQSILNAWMNKFTQKVAEETEKRREHTRPYRLLSFSDATLGTLIKNFSEVSVFKVIIGYCVIIVYAVIVLGRPWDLANSQAGVGVAGLLLVIFSIAAGLGFCALIGLPFSAASTQVLPFLALGISVDSIFILLQTTKETLAADAHQTPHNINRMNLVSSVVKKSGVSILITSLCISTGFACAAIIPVPALRFMCLQASILVLVNLVVVLLVFPAMLSLDIRRRNARRADLLCCFNAPPPKDKEDNRQSSTQPDDVVGLPSVSRTARDTTCCLPHPPPILVMDHDAKKQEYQISKDISRPPVAEAASIKFDNNGDNQIIEMTPSVASLGSTHSLVGEGRGIKACIVSNFERLWLSYVHFITGDKCRVVGVIFLLASIAASAWGVSKLKDGLSLTTLVPRYSPEAQFLTTQQKHFSIYHMFAVTKGHFEYPREQQLLHDFHSTFTRVPYILKDDDGGLPDPWLATFRDWLIGLQKAFDKDWASDCIQRDRWFANASDDGVMAYKLLVQTGHVDQPVDKNLVIQARLVDENGIINPRTFYNYLSAWVTNDAMAYSSSQADIRPEPRRWKHDRYNDYDLKIPKSSPIMYAQMPFFLRHLNDTESITDMIFQIREICDKFVEKGLPNFPTGVPFTFWEQYIHMRFFLMLALVAVVIGTFLIIAVTLLNVWVASLVVLVVSLLVFQLAGVMGILGIQLSAAPAVLMVASVGLGMEFTLHIVIGYLTAVGGRRRRVVLAMVHMAPPVIHGSLSTLLAALMLLFSEFDFIRRCFFYVVAGLVMLGAADGLFFLPIVLSIIGPSADLVSHAHPDRLPTPTPPPSPQPQPSPAHRCGNGVVEYHRHHPTHHHTSYHSAPHSSSMRHSSGRRPGPSSSCKKLPECMSSVGGGSAAPAPPSFSRHHHNGSNLSLSTITEEPHSSHSTQSSHEIVFEPQMVVETSTTYGGAGGGVSGADQSSGGGMVEGVGHVTTKVTATTKVKVELHTPLTSASLSSSVGSSTGGRSRNSTGSSSSSRHHRHSTAGTNLPVVSVHSTTSPAAATKNSSSSSRRGNNSSRRNSSSSSSSSTSRSCTDSSVESLGSCSSSGSTDVSTSGSSDVSSRERTTPAAVTQSTGLHCPKSTHRQQGEENS